MVLAVTVACHQKFQDVKVGKHISYFLNVLRKLQAYRLLRARLSGVRPFA